MNFLILSFASIGNIQHIARITEQDTYEINLKQPIYLGNSNYISSSVEFGKAVDYAKFYIK